MSFQPFQQAIVLTHEGTSTDQMVPYFSHRFRPLQPLTVFGRDAKAEPKCKPSHAVYYAWKDSELSAFFWRGGNSAMHLSLSFWPHWNASIGWQNRLAAWLAAWLVPALRRSNVFCS